MDLDTFLTTLYVKVDDWYTQYGAEHMQRHAGGILQMSDSEVLTVSLAGQWRVGVPWRSERGVVRYMQRHGRGWFPKMLEKSSFNQRTRQLWGAFVEFQQYLAAELERGDTVYECVDVVPLPACSLAQAASHDGHWLWTSGLGYGGNQGGWFWGEQLLTSVTSEGVVTGWLLGSAGCDDRWLLQAFLSHRATGFELRKPAGDKKNGAIPDAHQFVPLIAVGSPRPRPYVADRGFNGERWRLQWLQRYEAEVITVPPTNATYSWSHQASRWLASKRQMVDTVFSRLDSVFDLKRLNAHSRWGQYTRLAAKMAAYNFGIWLNRLLGRPDGALQTLIC